ncbi:unnamed protein product [Cochlearia groenlandica]
MLSFLGPILELFQVVLASLAFVFLSAFSIITLGGSVAGLAVATPLFIIFSPILVPATIATSLCASTLAIGMTALALILWLIKYKIGVKPKNNPPPTGAPPTQAGKEAGTSGDPATANKPGGEKPPGDKPAEDKSATKPSGDKPAGPPPGDKPPGDKKPHGDKPAGDKKPPGDKPAGDKKTTGR